MKMLRIPPIAVCLCAAQHISDMTGSLITILVADRGVHIDKDGIHGSVIAFLQNVINDSTFVCTTYSPYLFLSSMLSRYCCVITFNLPKPRFTFSCHHLRNSRLFPVAYQYLILLPVKESHLLSSLRCIAGRVRMDQCSLGLEYVLSAGFQKTVNQERFVFLLIPSHMRSVFTRVHLHILNLTLTDRCKLTLTAGTSGCRWILCASICSIGSLSFSYSSD